MFETKSVRMDLLTAIARGCHNVVIFDTIAPYLIAVYDSLRTHRFACTFSILNSTLHIFDSSFRPIFSRCGVKRTD